MTIHYDLRLYSKQCVEMAAEAYSNLANISVTCDGAKCFVAFSKKNGIKEDELMHLIGEFNNYLIQLENQTGVG